MDSHQASCIDASRSRQKSVVIPQAPNRKFMARRTDSTKIDTKDDTEIELKISQQTEECVKNKSKTKEDKNNVPTKANQNKELKKNLNDSSSTKIKDDKMHNTQHREESVENESEKKKKENNGNANEKQSKASGKNSTKDETAAKRTFRATGEWLSQEDILRAFEDVALSDTDDKLFRYALERVSIENQIDRLCNVRVIVVFNTKFKRTIYHGKPCSKLFIYLKKDGCYHFNWENPSSSRTSIKNGISASARSAFTSFVSPTSSTSGSEKGSSEQNERGKGIFEVIFQSLKQFFCDNVLVYFKTSSPS